MGGAGAAVAQTQEELGSSRAAELGRRRRGMQAKLSSRPRGCGRSSAADPADAVAAGAAAARTLDSLQQQKSLLCVDWNY